MRNRQTDLKSSFSESFVHPAFIADVHCRYALDSSRQTHTSQTYTGRQQHCQKKSVKPCPTVLDLKHFTAKDPLNCKINKRLLKYRYILHI